LNIDENEDVYSMGISYKYEQID